METNNSHQFRLYECSTIIIPSAAHVSIKTESRPRLRSLSVGTRRLPRFASNVPTSRFPPPPATCMRRVDTSATRTSRQPPRASQDSAGLYLPFRRTLWSSRRVRQQIRSQYSRCCHRPRLQYAVWCMEQTTKRTAGNVRQDRWRSHTTGQTDLPH